MNRLVIEKPLLRTANPFLSIITRKYKRPVGLSNNQESIKSLIGKDYEQIFINDPIGVGMLVANQGFQLATSFINGEYVFLLDDDDYITNPSMIDDLKQIHFEYNPDVIFFRMTIKNGMNNNYYPTSHCWDAKIPMIAHIGGSCFVVKKHLYTKFIHNFAHPRCGDFYFIDSIIKSGASTFWHNVKMCETGKVSRGEKE